MAIRTLVITPSAQGAVEVKRKALTRTSVADFENTGTFQVFNRAQRPTYEFDVMMEPLTRSEVESIQAFHFFHQGGRSFFFAGHPYDRIENPQLVGEGDGSRTQFFLANRNIDADSIAVQIFDGSANSTTTGFTLNAVAGIVTFSTAPDSGDDVLAAHAHKYLCVFPPEEIETTEFARNLFRMRLRLRETVL